MYSAVMEKLYQYTDFIPQQTPVSKEGKDFRRKLKISVYCKSNGA